MLKRLNEILSRPLFGTRVIPKDAAVDPALFQEEEFPVYCPKCDYLLRGLPDGKCPECGQSFQRGVLLVQQYVQNEEEVFLRRTFFGRLFYLYMRMVYVCQVFFVAASLVAALVVFTSHFCGFDSPYISKALWMAVVGLGCSLVMIALCGLVLLVRGFVVGLRGDEKRERVKGAMRVNNPETAKPQRPR